MDGWKVGLLLALSERGRWDVQEGRKESRLTDDVEIGSSTERRTNAFL